MLLAGKEIRRVNFGRTDSPVFAFLRRVLRPAREATSGFLRPQPGSEGYRHWVVDLGKSAAGNILN